MKTGKLIVISAPSGTGKSTIIGRLINDEKLRLEFSISATTRPPRKGEENGVNYYFMTRREFQREIKNDAFAEYQEVYEGRYYGTLKREIERINSKGNNVIMDVDVVGGINVKRLYGERALSIFIQPPSEESLKNRLLSRGTDSMEDINNRVAKAKYELGFAPQFDRCVINDILDVAVEEVRQLIDKFVNADDE